jgi:hypothetical protein
MSPERVYFVDWPHARVGAPFVDPIILLACAASDASIDVEAIVREHPPLAGVEDRVITCVLAAWAGFCAVGAITQPPPGLEPVRRAKIALTRAAVGWLEQRLP